MYFLGKYCILLENSLYFAITDGNNDKSLQFGYCTYLIEKGWQEINSYHPFPRYISSQNSFMPHGSVFQASSSAPATP